MTDDELRRQAEEFMDATSRRYALRARKRRHVTPCPKGGRWRVRPWRPYGHGRLPPRANDEVW